MRFSIQHRSHYLYANPASESFMELRVCPPTLPRQVVHSHALQVTPQCGLHPYTDYFGNRVSQFSIPHRHGELLIVAESVVETFPDSPPDAALEVSVSECRQLTRSRRLDLYEFLNESDGIVFAPELNREANRFFRPRQPIGTAVLALMRWIHETIRYTPGSTRIDTPPAAVLAQRKGVCQDMAQLMIAILRSAEIPARYVCGYIETEQQRLASEAADQQQLVGFAESHAWVEVCLPGAHWWGLDPTNNCAAELRHVVVSTGRDYLDTTPTRGVFKGSSAQQLQVSVQMRRLGPVAAADAPAA